MASFLEAEDGDGVFPGARQTRYLSGAPSPYGKRCLVHSCPLQYARRHSPSTTNVSDSRLSVSTSSASRKRSGPSGSCSTDSFRSLSHSQQYQGRKSKVQSGDLLDRHSVFFTDSRKPFTPRTLISDAKSYLLEYRYYRPAQRKKKNHHKQHAEAQTQTDALSFPPADRASERKVMTEQEITLKAEDRRYAVDEPERGTPAFPSSFLSETSLYSQQSSARSTVETEEEELLYLAFIEDVTNQILSLGLFSNRVLEHLFECHIQENKNRLDEGKMRHLLDILKADLGCSSAQQAHADWEGCESRDLQEFGTMEELEFTSVSQSQGKATTSEESLWTTDLPLKEPNKCESRVCRESPKETQSRDDFLEDVAEAVGAGTEPDSCVKSEDPAASTSPQATLTLTAYDCDLEASKVRDDLEESFAEALQVSHSYSQQ
ncbi:PREDICTED: spermatogenesis-associated protein 7 [Eurypyga helias]|uniref:spermatogenesis-associated protein 7 n=1 Tax=Eurypyga helias TaxID=54383 RepID=UPI00052877BD|nr:PREDICTED: spermatogenesis-associated protein 7 [Eurypyga helias]